MSIQESIDVLESRTLQLSLKPEEPASLFLLPAALANALLLDKTKSYTIGNLLTAFHTYILNHSLAMGRGLLKADGLFAPAGHSSHIPYSAALKNLCQQLVPA